MKQPDDKGSFNFRYPPIRFRRQMLQLFKKRAGDLAKERGVPEIATTAYLSEASEFFENNRNQPEDKS